MATNTQIKTGIDTDITNKTLPKSVLNTNVGTRMKSIVDYADQEVAALNNSLGPTAKSNDYNDLDNLPVIPQPLVKVQKTTITSAELLQLFTTPKTLLLNNDLTKIKIPISIYVLKNLGNDYVLNNNGFYFLNSTNNVEATLYLQCLTTSGTGYYQVSVPYSNGNMSGVERIKSYSIQASGGNPTGGTATLDVYVTYLEITL